jgi:hypothetical protein
MMTRSELVSMYSQYPQALAAEVARVLKPLRNDEDRIQHNAALGRFIVLFADERSEQLMWNNVAEALLSTARTTGDNTDVKS